MQRFFPVKKAVETVTVQDLIAAILYFLCADNFSGKKRQEAYNQAQKTAAFLQKRILASQQRLLCRAVWTSVAQITLALPMDNVIRLLRTALMTINPQVNDPD